MKNILTLAILLVFAVGFSQEKQALYTFNENGDKVYFSGTSTVSTNTSFITVSSSVELSNTNVKGLNQQSVVNIVTGTQTITLGDAITENKWFTIHAPESALDSVTIVPETGITFLGKDLEDNKIDNTWEGVVISDLEDLLVTKADATTYWLRGDFRRYAVDLFPDLAGSFSFPNSTNINITSSTATGVTPSLSAGTPNALKITSDNSSGADFGSQDIVVSPTIGDVYIFTGEMLVESGTFAHAQIREVSGNFSKFEADETNTTTWQPFTESLNITGTGNLVVDFPTNGAAFYRNMKITKQ